MSALGSPDIAMVDVSTDYLVGIYEDEVVAADQGALAPA